MDPSETRDKIYADFMGEDGASIELMVERTEEALERDGLGVTISNEALEMLSYQMLTWVATRILRQHQTAGVMAQRIEVSMTVKLS